MRSVTGYIIAAVIMAAISISGAAPCRAQQITDDTVDCDSLYEADDAAVPATLAEESVTLPTIPYRTPEAAAFMKYGEYSVNGYTGCPDINIPVCEIKDRDLTIPIALRYDARGIKVAQEASWVGLGWDLTVGGCINSVAEGNIDYLLRIAPWSEYEKLFNRYASTEFVVNANPVINDIYQDMANGVGEIDFYQAGFLGQSIVFFKNPYTNRYEALCDSARVYSIEDYGMDDKG